MKVLLINPPFLRYGGSKGIGGSLIPLNLCCLAAYARRDHKEVEFSILDAEARGLNLEATVSAAIQFQPDLIGITATTTAFDAIIALGRLLKQASPQVPLVLGGPHPSALPERSLRETGADFVAVGEGEVTFSELILALKQGEKRFDGIDGLAFLEPGGKYHQASPRQLLPDLDALPFPARDLVDNRLYSPPATKRVSLGINTMVSTSRGCPHNCGFCSFRSVWGRGTRVRSPQSVVAEIRECVERFGVSSINFADEFFTAQKPRVIEICRLMRVHGLVLPWVCSARAAGLDRETLAQMKAAGCREISFGIESGNPEILKRIDKKINLTEAERVLRTAQKLGLTTHASYILGYPGETIETIKETIRFAQKLNTDVAAFFIASPLPGSRLYREALEKGYLRPDATWRDYAMIPQQPPVLALPDLPQEILCYWQRQALKSYYFRLGYVLARLTRIRNWHEVLNLWEGLKTYFFIRRKDI
ncbi:MAG: B12-binding domain-containing radical SAM protein [Desulfobaccales bacterium]